MRESDRRARWPRAARVWRRDAPGPLVDTLLRWWASAWPNRVADGAGRYRRFAVGLCLLTVPVAASGLALVLDPSSGWRRGVAHLAVAGGCLWLARDLQATGSVLDRRRRPHLSGPVLFVALVALGLARTPAGEAVTIDGAVTLALPAAVMGMMAVTLLVLAEWRADPVLSMVGRGVAAGVALVVGTAGLTELARGVWGPWIHPVDLMATSVVLVATAYFEARVLARGLALSALAVQR